MGGGGGEIFVLGPSYCGCICISGCILHFQAMVMDYWQHMIDAEGLEVGGG